ncbi:NUDIX hydrolase [Taibaiella helva]|uniref:NUDIX hydrolase n=1 Tax=Taibaiella helva TaxID=2301235 RepID=UPI000E586CAC|nr:NUDIX domain-containing protein [Taibaiella helva]
MHFSRKIYINNRPLILTNSAGQYIADHPIAAGYLLLTGAFPRNFRQAKKHLAGLVSLGVIIEDISVDALIRELNSTYEPIEAAGGVVSNPEGGVLMIYRRGKWDLPKGKRDDGEAIEDCAVREVIEETGLPKLNLGDKICETYHVYDQGGTELLKTTHWYHMKTDKAFELYPQKEENILEARWVAEKKLGSYVHHSYEAIKEILFESGKRWQ